MGLSAMVGLGLLAVVAAAIGGYALKFWSRKTLITIVTLALGLGVGYVIFVGFALSRMNGIEEMD